MNAKQLITLAAVALAAGSALADDITPDLATQAVSSRSRAEVQAEVRQAAAQGQLLAAGEEDVGAPAVRSTVARSQVKAEVLAARQRGELMPAGEQLVAQHPVAQGKSPLHFGTFAAR